MTNNRKFYAAQSHRGFANEIDVYAFSSRAKRNAWVCEHMHDGDANSASLGAYAVTSAEAMRIAGRAIGRNGLEIRGKVNATYVA